MCHRAARQATPAAASSGYTGANTPSSCGFTTLVLQQILALPRACRAADTQPSLFGTTRLFPCSQTHSRKILPPPAGLPRAWYAIGAQGALSG